MDQYRRRLMAKFLRPDSASLLAGGASRMLRGLRTGDQRMLFAGAALVLLGWWRRPSARQRTLVFREELRPGRSVIVRYGRTGDLPEIEVARVPPGDASAGQRSR